MLVWVTFSVGFVACLLGALAIVRADRDWRRGPRRCRSCQQIRYGEDELCDACTAQARDQPTVVLDDLTLRHRSVDYADRAWAAPAVPHGDGAPGRPPGRR